MDNKLHIAEEIVVEHKLNSFADGGSCCLPVLVDDRHGSCCEILSLKSDEGSFRLDLCREVVVVRWVATSLAPAVIKAI